MLLKRFGMRKFFRHIYTRAEEEKKKEGREGKEPASINRLIASAGKQGRTVVNPDHLYDFDKVFELANVALRMAHSIGGAVGVGVAVRSLATLLGADGRTDVDGVPCRDIDRFRVVVDAHGEAGEIRGDAFGIDDCG